MRKICDMCDLPLRFLFGSVINKVEVWNCEKCGFVKLFTDSAHEVVEYYYAANS